MYLNHRKWRAAFGADAIAEFDFHERPEVLKVYPTGYHQVPAGLMGLMVLIVLMGLMVMVLVLWLMVLMMLMMLMGLDCG